MALEISQYDAEPALDFKNLHLSRLEIVQPVKNYDNEPIAYALTLELRMFAVDPSTGFRHYKKPRIIRIDDYYALAMEKASEGDYDLITAMQGIEHALAVIANDQGDYGTVSVI